MRLDVWDQERVPRLDKHPFALGDFVFQLGGFSDKSLIAFVVAGPGQAPVGHRALGVELEAPAEGAFRLVKPK